MYLKHGILCVTTIIPKFSTMPYLADSLVAYIPVDSVLPSLQSYVQGETPLSTWPAVMSMTVTYLLVVLGTREIMKDRAPFELTTLFRAHNLFLSVFSLILVVLLGEEVFSTWMKLGSYRVLCAEEAFTPRIEFYLVMAYLSRYYEFVDTIFLVLRKKPLTFLHVYHHSATVVMAFTQLNGRATACWVPALLNLGVHAIIVLRFLTVFTPIIHMRYQWKQHLTTLQIVQFILILAAAAFAAWNIVAYNWLPMVPHYGNCAGDLPIGLTGIAVIASYLLLFVNFFNQTYIKKPQVKTSHSTSARTKIDGVSSGSLLLRVNSTA
ncbi:GNS1/SUR4 family-domain-containing protein [Scleroderma yunnanense]